MPPNGPDCWPKEDSKKQWIVFYRLDDFTFTGIGTIEGNGEQWWDLPCKPHRVIQNLVQMIVQELCCYIHMDYFCHIYCKCASQKRKFLNTLHNSLETC